MPTTAPATARKPPRTLGRRCRSGSRNTKYWADRTHPVARDQPAVRGHYRYALIGRGHRYAAVGDLLEFPEHPDKGNTEADHDAQKHHGQARDCEHVEHP